MRDNNVSEEGSPLLGVAHARYWGDAGEKASRHPRDGSRKRWRQAAPVDVSRSSFRRHWRVSAGIAGVLMLSMALAGLGAIFSSVQRQRGAPRTSGASLDGLDNAAAAKQTPATKAPEESSHSRGERAKSLAWREKRDALLVFQIVLRSNGYLQPPAVFPCEAVCILCVRN